MSIIKSDYELLDSFPFYDSQSLFVDNMKE